MRRSNLHNPPSHGISPDAGNVQAPTMSRPPGSQMSGATTDVITNATVATQSSQPNPHSHLGVQPQQNLPPVPNLSLEQRQAYWAWHHLLTSHVSTPSQQQLATHYSSVPGMFFPPLNGNFSFNFGQTRHKASVGVGNVFPGANMHSSPVNTMPTMHNAPYPYASSIPPPPITMHPELAKAFSNEF